MAVKVLFIGEIVGKSGVFCIKHVLPKVREEYSVDFVIANADGVTGGYGIGKNHAIYLHKLGIDVLTGGECIYYKLDMVQHIQRAPYILRPANYPPGNPGRGWRVFEKNSHKIGVINMLGQSGFPRVHLSNPFSYLPELAAKIKQETPIIIVDFHAATTAEKYTLFHLLDGKVSAVVGTHTKVLTSDETIMKGGTGVICDAGRTGSLYSVGGLVSDIEIQKFLTQIPERSEAAWEGLELQGVLMELDDQGATTHIQRIRYECKEVPDDREWDSEKN